MKSIITFLFTLSFTVAYCDTGDQWSKVIGTMSQVYTTVEYIWGIDPYHKLYYCVRPCTGNWVYSTESVSMVDVESIFAWLISHDTNVYVKNSDNQGSWSQRSEISKNMIDIAASSNLYVWFLQNNKEIYRWRHITATTQKQTGKFDQIDSNIDYIYLPSMLPLTQ